MASLRDARSAWERANRRVGWLAFIGAAAIVLVICFGGN